jgi:hypothetical protein
MSDYVKVEAQSVSNALGAWDDAASQLKGELVTKANAALGAFDAHLAAAGNDHAGNAYKKAVDPGQVHQLLGPGGDADKVVDEVVKLGTNTRTAINRSLASDAQQAEEMKKPQKDL